MDSASNIETKLVALSRSHKAERPAVGDVAVKFAVEHQEGHSVKTCVLSSGEMDITARIPKTPPDSTSDAAARHTASPPREWPTRPTRLKLARAPNNG